MLFNHSHGGGYTIGKKEFIEGRSYLQPKPYAKELTDLGFVALCIDHWIFGERSHTSELDMFKLMLWRGQVLWGMMVYDSLRAMDVLAAAARRRSRARRDAGHVDGQHDGLVAGRARRAREGDGRHQLPHGLRQPRRREGARSCTASTTTCPRLLKHFTTSQINALIAPRAHLGLIGLRDALTPLDGVDRIDRELSRPYARQGHPERWKLLRYDVAHQETPEGREAIVGS